MTPTPDTDIHSCGPFCTNPAFVEQRTAQGLPELSFAARCKLSEDCLPDAPYREMLKKLHDEMLAATKAAQSAKPDLKALVQKVHKAKGRYHTQLAMCELYDACGLPNVKPGDERIEAQPERNFCATCGKRLGDDEHIHTCTPPGHIPTVTKLVERKALSDAGFHNFLAWAKREGYDTAYTYDTDRSRWLLLNPMTADLYKAWSAAHGIHPGKEPQK